MKWKIAMMLACSSLVGGLLGLPASTRAQETHNLLTLVGTGATCTPATDPCGDGGPASLARLNNPRGLVAMDSGGNLYFADSMDHRIRKVDRLTGNISTVVGTGAPCVPTTDPCGDEGLATQARINNPYSVAIDDDDNLYISEFSGHRIRKVDSDGKITTVVGTGTACASSTAACGDGGPAKSAQLNIPRAINFDSDDKLWIPDGNNHRLRMVDAAGNISTVAGTGAQCLPATDPCGDGGPAISAKLNGPHGVAFDSDGNIYIDDTNIHRIRKIDKLTGNISTVAGTGVPGSSGNGGQAAAAQLNQPRGIALDSEDNFYISESFGHQIRQVDTAGFIATLAGTGVAGFFGDGGPAIEAQFAGPRGVNFDAADNLYIADSGNQRIRRLSLAAGVELEPATLNTTRSKGKWVTAALHFPSGWDASQVDFDSVSLQAIDATNGAVRSNGNELLQTTADPEAPVSWEDTDEDGVPDLLVIKFHRADVVAWSGGNSMLRLRVVGEFQAMLGSPVGRFFSGDTEVRIIPQ